MTVDIGALVTSFGGLGATIAGAVPSLKKPKRNDASSRAAQRGSAQVQKAAIGAAGTGGGSSRGLALRSGLRAASQAALESGGAMAAAAHADEQRFQKQVDARNSAIAGIANAGASGLAQTAQALIRPQEDLPEFAGAQEALQEQPELVSDPTGLAGPAAGGTPEQQALELQAEQNMAAEGLDPNLSAEAKARNQELVSGMVDFDPVQEAVATNRGGFQPEIETQLEMKLQMKSLMLQEAERQGITIDSVLAKINRGLGLQPGQTSSNAFGVSLMPDGAGVEEE